MLAAMALQLGDAAAELLVVLTKGGRLGFELEAVDARTGTQPEPFPADTFVRLDLYDEDGIVVAQWSAAIAGNVATFSVPAADAGLAIVAGAHRAKLWTGLTTDPLNPVLWAKGPVEVDE